MLPESKYYSVTPVEVAVSEQEFINFIQNYPRKLTRDVCGISDPPMVSYNDFEMADRWPYSIVAVTYGYDDDPNGYYYVAEKDRTYKIMQNYAEVFESRTSINTSEYEREHEDNSPFKIVKVENVTGYAADTGNVLFTLTVDDE